MLGQIMRVESAALGRIKFSWKLPGLIQQADMSVRELDDSPVRLVLAFESDRNKFSSKNAMLSELAHLPTGEPLPYATRASLQKLSPTRTPTVFESCHCNQILRN